MKRVTPDSHDDDDDDSSPLSAAQLRSLPWYHISRNRFCKQFFQGQDPRKFPDDALKAQQSFNRILTDDAGSAPYHRRRGQLKSVNHWGQRKLLLSEIEFLTNHCPDDNDDDERTILLYAGSAPGTHVPYLAELFPNVDFHLVDPSPFKVADTTRPDGSLQIKVMQKFFDDQTAREYRDRKKLLFVSDIRTADMRHMGYAEIEDSVVRDNIMQLGWHLLLSPLHSLLKFRLPYGPGRTEYLNGTVYLPVWGPQTTTETRLCVPMPPCCDQGKPSFDEMKAKWDKFRDMDRSCEEYQNLKRELGIRTWNNVMYEQQLFYFNTVTRVQVYEHNLSFDQEHRTGLDHSYDSTSEIVILRNYLRKFKSCWLQYRARIGKPIAMVNGDDCGLICKMSLEMNKMCSPESGRTLKTKLPPPEERECWFKPKVYDSSSQHVYEAQAKPGMLRSVHDIFWDDDQGSSDDQGRCLQILQVSVDLGMLDPTVLEIGVASGSWAQTKAGIVRYLLEKRIRCRDDVAVLSKCIDECNAYRLWSGRDAHRRGGPLYVLMRIEEQAVVVGTNQQKIGPMIEKIVQLKPTLTPRRHADGSAHATVTRLAAELTNILKDFSQTAEVQLVAGVVDRAKTCLHIDDASISWLSMYEILFAFPNVWNPPAATSFCFYSLHFTSCPSGTVGAFRHLLQCRSSQARDHCWKWDVVGAMDDLEGMKILPPKLVITLECPNDSSQSLKLTHLALELLADRGNLILSLPLLIGDDMDVHFRLKILHNVIGLFDESVHMVKPIASLSTTPTIYVVLMGFSREKWKESADNTSIEEYDALYEACVFFGELQFCAIQSSRIEEAATINYQHQHALKLEEYFTRFGITPLP